MLISLLFRAQDWNLDVPDWTGRMKIVSVGPKAVLKLEDRDSGKLYAQCPVDAFPSSAIEPVLDSSRFFAIRITDETGARSAFVGLGFRDRADSFDMNVALQDHFKGIKREEAAKKEAAATPDNSSAMAPQPKLDLGFRAGESITIKMGSSSKVREKPSASMGGLGAGGILLPPPPASGSRVQQVRPASGVPTPPNSGSSGSLSSQQQPPKSGSNDLLGLDFNQGESAQKPEQPPTSQPQTNNWIDFN